MDKKIITLQYEKDDSSLSTVGLLVGETGFSGKLFMNGQEIEKFIIVDDDFTSILTMIENSNQDIFVESFAPLKEIPKANVYTKVNGENIPLGTIEPNTTPSIDDVIIVFENSSVWDSGHNVMIETFSKFKKLGKIVTVDAR